MVGSIGNSSVFIVPALQSGGAKAAPVTSASRDLTEEEQKEVQELKIRDQEVRTHESAHKTAGGPYAGSISFETQTGPDGREYAIGGETQIDASPIPGKPDATIRKMDIVIRAALAPAEPSSQDYAVARAAQQARIAAQKELNELRETEKTEKRESAANPDKPLTNLALLNEQREEEGGSYTSMASDAAALYTTPK